MEWEPDTAASATVAAATSASEAAGAELPYLIGICLLEIFQEL